MKINLFSVLGLIAIASGFVALLRIRLSHDLSDVVIPNVIIGSICLAGMMILNYKFTKRRKVERRT